MNYQDPRMAAIYDSANPFAQDAEFYLSLAGPESRSVLDLGCGTGTLCCALAQRRHRVTGIDPAAAMLAIARTKPFSERIAWVESSAQAYRSHRRFDLIVMTGHAFQVLLFDDDVLAVLETMRLHLKPRGRIAFETRNPRLDWVGAWNARSRTISGGQIVETLNITAHDGEFISFESTYQLPDTTLTTSTTLRFPSREHIQSLIERSGLVVWDVFGDWHAGPFEPACSHEIIFIAGMRPPTVAEKTR